MSVEKVVGCRIYLAEGNHVHIDKEGRCSHMKGRGRLCTIIARRRSTHNMMLLWHTLNVSITYIECINNVAYITAGELFWAVTT